MTTNQLTEVLWHLRHAAAGRAACCSTDGQLLGTYLAGGGEEAFTELVRRYPLTLF
jgi:hypothetical protein